MSFELDTNDRVGEWILEERIGRGGFGEVWRARHHVLPDRLVAVKIPHEGSSRDRLRREGLIQDKLKGDARIVQTIGLDPDHDPPYLAVELIDGETLRDRLRREERLSPDEAVRIGCEVLGALAAAHAVGVTHRDVKPENVLIEKATGSVKVADFGLGQLSEPTKEALEASLSHLSREGSIAGTLAYMAPEQREVGRKIDGRADLYAFGIVLFEMITGTQPVGGEVPGDHVAGVDTRIDDLFRKCYTRLQRRYGSADEALADLLTVRDVALAPVKRVTKAITRKRPRPKTVAGEAAKLAAARASPTRPAGESAPSLEIARPKAGPAVAGVFERGFATFLDVCLFVFGLMVLRSLTGPLSDHAPGFAAGRALAWLLGRELPLDRALLLVDALGLGFLWTSIGNGLLGFTPGKLLVGLRVRRLDGRRIGLLAGLWRSVCYVVSAAPLGIGFLSIALHPQRRAFHDMMSGSVVVWRDR